MQLAIHKHPLEEPHCGDQAEAWEHDGKTVLCMVDGLGHGRAAEHAARAALHFVVRHLHEPLPDIFAGCDIALHNTRGVAMGIGVADPAAGTLTYAGIGNTRALVIGKETTQLTNYYGIVGGGYRMLKTETIPLAQDDLVIMCTDGIHQPLDLSAFDDIARSDVTCLAEKILRAARREMDDAAVLVFRLGE